jgi:hypothetical protein
MGRRGRDYARIGSREQGRRCGGPEMGSGGMVVNVGLVGEIACDGGIRGRIPTAWRERYASRIVIRLVELAR